MTKNIAAIVLFICISVHGYIPFVVPSSHENYIMGSEKKNSWMAPSSGEAVPYMTWNHCFYLMLKFNIFSIFTFMVQAALSYLLAGMPCWVQS